MKIGFDISQAGVKATGCGNLAKNYAVQLIDQIKDLTLYGTFGPNFCDKTILTNFLNHKNLVKYCFTNKTYAKHFWNNETLEKHLEYPDIIQSNNFWCPDQIKKAKIIYTLYDLSFLEMPENTTDENIFVCLNGLLKAIENADHFVAISEYTKKNFLEFFPFINKSKVSVIYPGFKSPTLFQTCPKNFDFIDSNYFLAVGTIEPRKNYQRLIEAYCIYYDEIKNEFDPMPLIIVGGQGWGDNSLFDIIKEKKLEEYIQFLGYVNEYELSWLYSNCYCNLYVSLFEGFGLPVLEGMKHGCPTITSNISSIPEITGSSALLVNPYNSYEIVKELLSVHKNKKLRDLLAKKSVEQASKFTWNQSTNQLLDLYKSLL